MPLGRCFASRPHPRYGPKSSYLGHGQPASLGAFRCRALMCAQTQHAHAPAFPEHLPSIGSPSAHYCAGQLVALRDGTAVVGGSLSNFQEKELCAAHHPVSSRVPKFSAYGRCAWYKRWWVWFRAMCRAGCMESDTNEIQSKAEFTSLPLYHCSKIGTRRNHSHQAKFNGAI